MRLAGYMALATGLVTSFWPEILRGTLGAAGTPAWVPTLWSTILVCSGIIFLGINHCMTVLDRIETAQRCNRS
jgi:hypothetical protein